MPENFYPRFIRKFLTAGLWMKVIGAWCFIATCFSRNWTRCENSCRGGNYAGVYIKYKHLSFDCKCIWNGVHDCLIVADGAICLFEIIKVFLFLIRKFLTSGLWIESNWSVRFYFHLIFSPAEEGNILLFEWICKRPVLMWAFLKFICCIEATCHQSQIFCWHYALSTWSL